MTQEERTRTIKYVLPESTVADDCLGEFYRFLNMRLSLFFFFYGKGGEDRTRDLIVHNLTTCLRRHCKKID